MNKSQLKNMSGGASLQETIVSYPDLNLPTRSNLHDTNLHENTDETMIQDALLHENKSKIMSNEPDGEGSTWWNWLTPNKQTTKDSKNNSIYSLRSEAEGLLVQNNYRDLYNLLHNLSLNKLEELSEGATTNLRLEIKKVKKKLRTKIYAEGNSSTTSKNKDYNSIIRDAKSFLQHKDFQNFENLLNHQNLNDLLRLIEIAGEKRNNLYFKILNVINEIKMVIIEFLNEQIHFHSLFPEILGHLDSNFDVKAFKKLFGSQDSSIDSKTLKKEQDKWWESNLKLYSNYTIYNLPNFYETKTETNKQVDSITLSKIVQILTKNFLNSKDLTVSLNKLDISTLKKLQEEQVYKNVNNLLTKPKALSSQDITSIKIIVDNQLEKMMYYKNNYINYLKKEPDNTSYNGIEKFEVVDNLKNNNEIESELVSYSTLINNFIDNKNDLNALNILTLDNLISHYYMYTDKHIIKIVDKYKKKADKIRDIYTKLYTENPEKLTDPVFDKNPLFFSYNQLMYLITTPKSSSNSDTNSSSNGEKLEDTQSELDENSSKESNYNATSNSGSSVSSESSDNFDGNTKLLQDFENQDEFSDKSNSPLSELSGLEIESESGENSEASSEQITPPSTPTEESIDEEIDQFTPPPTPIDELIDDKIESDGELSNNDSSELDENLESTPGSESSNENTESDGKQVKNPRKKPQLKINTKFTTKDEQDNLKKNNRNKNTNFTSTDLFSSSPSLTFKLVYNLIQFMIRNPNYYSTKERKIIVSYGVYFEILEKNTRKICYSPNLILKLKANGVTL